MADSTLIKARNNLAEAMVSLAEAYCDAEELVEDPFSYTDNKVLRLIEEAEDAVQEALSRLRGE